MENTPNLDLLAAQKRFEAALKQSQAECDKLRRENVALMRDAVRATPPTQTELAIDAKHWKERAASLERHCANLEGELSTALRDSKGWEERGDILRSENKKLLESLQTFQRGDWKEPGELRAMSDELGLSRARESDLRRTLDRLNKENMKLRGELDGEKRCVAHLHSSLTASQTAAKARIQEAESAEGYMRADYQKAELRARELEAKLEAIQAKLNAALPEYGPDNWSGALDVLTGYASARERVNRIVQESSQGVPRELRDAAYAAHKRIDLLQERIDRLVDAIEERLKIIERSCPVVSTRPLEERRKAP